MTDTKPDMPETEASPFLGKWPRRIEGSRMLRLWVIMDNERQEALIPPSQIAGLFVVGKNKTQVKFMNGATARLSLPLNEAYDAVYHENTTNPINDLLNVSSTLVEPGAEYDDDIYLGNIDGQDWFVEKKQTFSESFYIAAARAQTLATPKKPWQLPPKKVLQEMFNNRSKGAFAGIYTINKFYLSCEQDGLLQAKWEDNNIAFNTFDRNDNRDTATRLVYAAPAI